LLPHSLFLLKKTTTKKKSSYNANTIIPDIVNQKLLLEIYKAALSFLFFFFFFFFSLSLSLSLSLSIAIYK